MNKPTRHLPARLRSSAIYSLYLAGEVKAPGWMMQVDKGRLLGAIDAPSPSPTFQRPLRATGAFRSASPSQPCGPGPSVSREGRGARTVTLVVCERGLSVRSHGVAIDVAGLGFWASPLIVKAARLRALVEGLPGPEVDLAYSGGRLMVDWKTMKAREL